MTEGEARAAWPNGLATEYCQGEWRTPTDDSVPEAVVTFSAEPSPETGHEGWVWWALGRMGDAPTFDDAKAAAEAMVLRIVGRAR